MLIFYNTYEGSLLFLHFFAFQAEQLLDVLISITTWHYLTWTGYVGLPVQLLPGVLQDLILNMGQGTAALLGCQGLVVSSSRFDMSV